MLHRHVSTAAQNGQTKCGLQGEPFIILEAAICTGLVDEGEARGIQLVAVCSVTTRCH